MIKFKSVIIIFSFRPAAALTSSVAVAVAVLIDKEPVVMACIAKQIVNMVQMAIVVSLDDINI